MIPVVEVAEAPVQYYKNGQDEIGMSAERLIRRRTILIAQEKEQVPSLPSSN